MSRLHLRVDRAFATLRHNPGNVLRGILDIAGLAMHAILRIDLQAWIVTGFVPHDLVHAGRAITLFGCVIEGQIGGDGNGRIL